MPKVISGSASFQCARCHYHYMLSPQDFRLVVVEGTQREMGLEKHFVSVTERPCEKCGQAMKVQFDAWEYPAGVIRHSEHTETGVENIHAHFHMAEIAEPNQNNENRVIGAAAGGAIFGASVGGPAGALIGGILGAILGNAANKPKDGGSHG